MENYDLTIKKIKEQIQQADKILVVAHEKPDGDTLGAVAAFSLFLEENNKSCLLFCVDPVPEGFAFLSNLYKIKNSLTSEEQKQIDLIITLDCGDLKRSGLAGIMAGFSEKCKLINIDHHLSNPHFGDYNIVFPESSSTSEIVFKIFSTWKQPINKNIATALLNGIFTDTGAFSTPSTTFNSLLIAGVLINYGGRMQEVSHYNFHNKKVSSLKLWGRALDRLQINKKYNIAYTVILKKDMDELKANEHDLEGLSSFFNNLSETNASLLLREDGDLIRGSLRTTKPNIDVSKLAKAMGGGGHIKASGFAIRGKLIYNGKNWRVE